MRVNVEDEPRAWGPVHASTSVARKSFVPTASEVFLAAEFVFSSFYQHS